MRKLLMLAVTALSAMAFTTASAFATELPYGDTNPDHYRDVYITTDPFLDVDCSIIDCTFTGTSDDFTLTFEHATNPPISVTCESLTLGYEMDVNGSWIDSFEVVSATKTGSGCSPGTPNPTRPQHVCAYSASGDFVSDVEFWIRDKYLSQSNIPASFGIYGRLTGTAPAADELDADGIVFTDALYGVNNGYTATVDGTIQFDQVVQFGRAGVPCTFPELAS